MLGINKQQVAQRFAKAGQSYTEQAVVQKKICQHLTALMLDYLAQKSPARVFEIGCGSGNLSHLLMQHFQMKNLILNDLYSDVQEKISVSKNQILKLNHIDDRQDVPLQWLIGDIEKLLFPTALNLITSSSVLQWITDLEGIFAKSACALQPDGWLCFSTFGQHNLREIKALTGQGLDYLARETIGEKLERQGFEVLSLTENTETLYFEHPKNILQHLKATGVTATAANFRWTKQSLAEFYQNYQKFSLVDQNHQLSYALTYHPIYCIARKKP